MRKDEEQMNCGAEQNGAEEEMIQSGRLQELEKELREHLHVQAYSVPQPGEMDTQRLIALLQPEFNKLKQGAALAAMPLRQLPEGSRPSLTRYWVTLAGSLGKSFWLANAAVFIMMTLISKTQAPENMGAMFGFLMPLFMMICIGYSYRTWDRQMREVESITPYPPALQMLSRLLMAVGVNLVFGLASSLYLDVSVRGFAIVPFLLGWLSEVLLVGGVLAAAMFYKGMKWGFAFGFAVWFLFQSKWWKMYVVDAINVSAAAEYAFQLLAIAGGLALFGAAYRKCLRIRWVDRS